MSMDFMKDDGVFLPMLNDTGRNTFYDQALRLASPGKTVCDIGAGTGFLSILAVHAGATRVIAVERDIERYEYLTQNIRELGLTDKIETYYGEFLDSDIAADLYVSETLNTQIFGEDIVKLSNHVVQHGGKFIPSGFRIWAEVYQDHPIFILDLARSEAYDFSPGIEIDAGFSNLINRAVQDQYNLQETVFRANQLNRLFPMLHRFNDVKLVKLGETIPVVVDLNQYNVESNIEVTIPESLLSSIQTQENVMAVIKWQAYFEDVVLDCDKCWFGNVAKLISKDFQTKPDVTFRYDPECRDWRLSY